METLYQVLGIIGAGLIIFLLYRTIKGRPEQFSKSFLTMGVLAIMLIGFVALLVLMLRNT